MISDRNCTGYTLIFYQTCSRVVDSLAAGTPVKTDFRTLNENSVLLPVDLNKQTCGKHSTHHIHNKLHVQLHSTLKKLGAGAC